MDPVDIVLCKSSWIKSPTNLNKALILELAAFGEWWVVGWPEHLTFHIMAPHLKSDQGFGMDSAGCCLHYCFNFA